LCVREAKHFDRDPDTNELLWFGAPPMNVARDPEPKYSLAYLHFLAMKRKEKLEETAMEVDGEGEVQAKKAKLSSSDAETDERG
jgi:chromatin structure-remodeling complex subunit RSC1/2